MFRVYPVSGENLNDKSRFKVFKEVTALDLCSDPTINLGGTM
jgi:hypothetical protein